MKILFLCFYFSYYLNNSVNKELSFQWSYKKNKMLSLTTISQVGNFPYNFLTTSKLSGAVGTLEGTDTIKMDIERLEEQAHVNFMKFSQAIRKVLHLDWVSLWY